MKTESVYSKTPPASSIEVHERMSRQPQQDTAPEFSVRRAAHALGLRYRTNRSPAKGFRSKADMVFPVERIAVFIDGCFWHGCPEHGTWPKSNAEWWRQKIEANKTRDNRIDSQLIEMGWKSIRIWAHEEPVRSAVRIQRAVMDARARNPR